MSGYANRGKKFSIAFIKYFSILIRLRREILFINLLIQKDFLNTRSRQSSFPLTNQIVLPSPPAQFKYGAELEAPGDEYNKSPCRVGS